jgi:hypothetical protein
MTTPLTVGSNTSIPLYQYEPFSYTWTEPGAVRYTTTTSTNVAPFVSSGTGGVVFSSLLGIDKTSSNEVITIQAFQDVSASILLASSSNVVTIGPARFVDDASQSLSNRRFTFYKNEPIQPTAFSSFYSLASTPITTVTLPAGIGFVSNSTTRYTLTGTPLVQIPSSNYTVIGSNASKYIQCPIAIGVNGERMVLDLSGTSIVSGMQVGTAISQQTFTARCPPYPRIGSNLCNFRYAWTQLPLGLEFADSDGVSVGPSPFQPRDPSGTLILRGTPTLAGAEQFANLMISQATVNVTATRISQSPFVTASQDITVSFAETVLFNPPPGPFEFFTGVPLDPSKNFVQAQTYFAGSNVPITSITAPGGLPSGVSLNFVAGTGRAYLTGTPTTAGTGSYTFRATNATPKTQDVAATISVITDDITLSGPVDVCYNFIISRPASSALTGYYEAPIAWSATASSGLPVSFSAPALAGTGLGLDVSGSSAILTGLPDTLTPLRTLRVTASAVGSPATASRDVNFAVVDDIFSFSDISANKLSFVQNKPITPVQITATTLSERSVVSYTSSNLPGGLRLSTDGLLTGTPITDTSGSLTVVASTGYSRGSNSYPYSITPDTVLFLVSPSRYVYPEGASVSVDVGGVAYSGGVVSNYAFSNLANTYGLSINSGTGVISGNLPTNIPPDLLPAFCNFYVTASAGLRNTSMQVQLATANPIYNLSYLLVQTISNTTMGPTSLYTSLDTSLNAWGLQGFNTSFDTWVTDFSIKNTSVDSNFYMAPRCILTDSTSGVWRSSNGYNFDLVIDAFPPAVSVYQTRPYKILNLSNTSTWYAAGSALTLDEIPYAALFQSTTTTSNQEGLNWTLVNNDRIQTRQGDTMMARRPISVSNSYVAYGLAFGMASNVMMMGGTYDSNLPNPTPGGDPAPIATMVRTSDDGDRWDTINNPLRLEVGNFSMDGPVWVATGSSDYRTSQTFPAAPLTPSGGVRTLAWSEDLGQTWSDATGTTPDIIAYDVGYASNTWLATGWTQGTLGFGFWTIKTRVVCSTDGKAWSDVTLPVTFTEYEGGNRSINQFPEAASLWFDTDNATWNILVKMNKSTAPTDYRCILYTHDVSTSLTSGWTTRVAALTAFDGVPDLQLRNLARRYTRQAPPSTAFLTFFNLNGLGPTLVSPAERSFLIYQYVRFTPIVLSATGTGTIYYFVEESQLFDGLEFDPLTATFSGKSVSLGTRNVDVYLADSNGVSKVTLTFTTVLPFVVRDGVTPASAYTSLLRQYTVVNAARNAENRSVYPAESRTIGEFTRPYPPDEISATVDPKCYSTSNCP